MKRAAVLLAVLALPSSAAAFFPPGATVISASPERQELADDVSQVAVISGNGRYVAFQTRATNLFAVDDPDPEGTDRLGGVFVRDLDSGALELVAAGDSVAESDGALLRTGARNPSISADGRYVSFSTAYALVPNDFNGAVDVYVRDRQIPAAAPGAYELISSVAYAGLDGPDGTRPGADTWPATSMSADGRLVAFRTLAASDAAGPNTPLGQLLVRDRATRTTRLVTRAAADGGPAGGAAGPTALSADGTSIVWIGGNARAQTAFLTGEPYADIDQFYLWQRLVDPAAPTRRITGMVDLDDPACPTQAPIVNDPGATGPCYGPLTTTDSAGASISGRQLAISGDGWRVWYLTPGFPRPSPLFSGLLDLWSADLRAGVSRKSGAVELTREGAANDQLAGGNIDGLSVTPDGRHLAITTSRVRFPNGALRLPGTARALPDQREVYVADLQTNTLERVLKAFDGSDANGAAGTQVSISADGRRVALTSVSSNLFFGDANNRADAFVAFEGAVEAVGTPEPEPTIDPGGIIGYPIPDPPRLRISSRHGRNGVLLVTVRAPAAGRIVLDVRGRLPAPGGRRSPLRIFANDGAKLKRKGVAQFTVRPLESIREPLARFGRLSATARARFDPKAKGPKLSASRAVRLLAPKRSAKRPS